MATNTEVNVRINVDAKGADNSVGSIKKQLKEATNELIAMRDKFGDSSNEAVNAAKKVAQLKDAIGDAKAMTDAFDPDAKFKAFGAALQGVAGGFAAVQGAQALFGSESEAVSKTLAKVQGAMALSQGINSVLQARDSFKNLGAVLQNNVLIQKALNFVMTGSLKTQQQMIATKEADVAVTETQTTAQIGLATATSAGRVAMIALRGAILATGIGALVIGVMALVSAVGDWVSGEEESKAAIEASNKAMEAQEEHYKKVSEEIKYQGELKKLNAEIAGKSAKDIYEIQKQTDQAAIKAAQENAAKQQKIYSDYYEAKKIVKSNGDVYFEASEYDQQKKLRDASIKADAELLNLQREFTKSSLGEQKRLHELSLQANQEFSSLEQSNYLAGIKDADTRGKEKARLDYENAVQSTKAKGYAIEDETKVLSELEKKKNLEIQAIIDAANEKAKAKADATAKERKAKTDAANKEIADAEKSLNEKIAALNDELLFMSIKNEDERAKKKLEIQYLAGIREIEQSKANENLKLDAILALQAKFDADTKAIDDAREAKNKEEADAKRQKAIDYENETFKILEENRINNIKDANDKAFEQESLRFQIEIDALYQQLNNKEITEDEFRKRREALEGVHQTNLTTIQDAAIEARKKEAEAERQAKIAQYQEIGNLANELSNIIGQNTAVGKALALSQIAIDTGVAISSLTRNSEANPLNAPTSGIAGAIQFASGLIRIIANIKKAKDLLSQAKVSAKGGSAGGNTSVNIPATAPLPPTLSQTTLNQGQINQLSSATARAFVLESDVSGNQERIQRLNRAARIS